MSNVSSLAKARASAHTLEVSINIQEDKIVLETVQSCELMLQLREQPLLGNDSP